MPPLPLQSDWAFVAGNLDLLLAGTGITIGLTAASILLGFLLGFPAGAVEVYSRGPLKRAVESAGVVLRGTPLLVIIILLFFGLSVSSSAFVTATIALGLRSAAYQSQIFRGALQSVDEGQLEAARAIGMGRLQAIRSVVVPQALRRSVPGFQNEFTIVLKDTSIAIVIGLGELLTVGQNLYQGGQSTAALEIFLTVSLIYFVLTFVTNRSLDYVDDHFSIPGGERA
ncbi:amino acid ABC transporter permease [Haloarcula argentinensis]|uniref:Amino acid ABC transporter permease n=1 Tax=Haloarcula argentinensis TaxID=43776 RepID=A0A830FUY7_HALAR|nr:amino acid ABC transporter permease [Haloarcula argentinensis]GGM43924.1 amino acid ABC transporter permease [Haloarcula argentinensis]